jgi:hypothetical protein
MGVDDFIFKKNLQYLSDSENSDTSAVNLAETFDLTYTSIIDNHQQQQNPPNTPFLYDVSLSRPGDYANQFQGNSFTSNLPAIHNSSMDHKSIKQEQILFQLEHTLINKII